MPSKNGYSIDRKAKSSASVAGLARHNLRQKDPDDYRRKIDFSKTELNEDLTGRLSKFFDASAGTPQGVRERIDRLIESAKDQGAHIQHSEDPNHSTTLWRNHYVQASREWFASEDDEDPKGLDPDPGEFRMERVEEWLEYIDEWIEETGLNERVVDAQLHLDESTPHIHLITVPMVVDQIDENTFAPVAFRDNQINDRQALRERHDKLEEVTPPELERGTAAEVEDDETDDLADFVRRYQDLKSFKDNYEGKCREIMNVARDKVSPEVAHRMVLKDEVEIDPADYSSSLDYMKDYMKKTGIDENPTVMDAGLALGIYSTYNVPDVAQIDEAKEKLPELEDQVEQLEGENARLQSALRELCEENNLSFHDQDLGIHIDSSESDDDLGMGL